MELAAKIDPVEVLSHLKEMGYHDVSPHQLKEFIHDLKKLIVFDNMSPTSGSCMSYLSSCNLPLNSENSTASRVSSTPRTSSSSGISIREAPCLSERRNQKENIAKFKGKKCLLSEDDFREAVKPKSSFIRPWNLQGTSGCGKTGRSDPVSLYHHYQTLWAQQKCPGEDSHADLRWVIREKMLGQDPHLYSQTRMKAGRKNTKLIM